MINIYIFFIARGPLTNDVQRRLCEIEKKMPLEWSFYAQEIAACIWEIWVMSLKYARLKNEEKKQQIQWLIIKVPIKICIFWYTHFKTVPLYIYYNIYIYYIIYIYYKSVWTQQFSMCVCAPSGSMSFFLQRFCNAGLSSNFLPWCDGTLPRGRSVQLNLVN